MVWQEQDVDMWTKHWSRPLELNINVASFLYLSYRGKIEWNACDLQVGRLWKLLLTWIAPYTVRSVEGQLAMIIFLLILFSDPSDKLEARCSFSSGKKLQIRKSEIALHTAQLCFRAQQRIRELTGRWHQSCSPLYTPATRIAIIAQRRYRNWATHFFATLSVERIRPGFEWEIDATKVTQNVKIFPQRHTFVLLWCQNLRSQCLILHRNHLLVS